MTDDTQPVLPIDETPSARRYLLAAFLLLLPVLVIGAGVVLIQQLQREPVIVTVRLDGLPYEVTTTAEKVRDVLAQEQIPVDESTIVMPSLDSAVHAGMLIDIDNERSITLTVDGLTSVFRTIMDNPRQILDSAGVSIEPGDQVEVDGTRVEVDRLEAWPLPVNSITVRHTIPVTITADGVVTEYRVTAETVGDALLEAGIALYLGDEIAPSLDTPVADGLNVIITRSTPVTIIADGITTETRARGQTVGEALAAAGIILAGLDFTVPSENTELEPGMTIRVTRVTEEMISESIPVPFETVYQADAELELDQTRTLQAGVEGVDQRNIRIQYADGVEVNRFDEGVTRVQEPVNHIIGYGTKIVLRTIDTPDGPREYWRKLRMYATSYHPAALGGDNVTATGRILTKGIVAINPRVVPYGTQLYVDGYGVGLAADTGGPRSTPYWIDLGYDDENYEHWAGWVEVYLLTPVPENAPYLLP